MLIYPIGLVKGWSAKVDGEFMTFAYDDPRVPTRIASLTYNYHLLIPAVDLDLPCRFTLPRSGNPTARKLNTAMKRSEPRPAWELAFVLTTAVRQNEKDKWFVAEATATKPKPDHIARAGELAALIAHGATNDRHEP